MPFQQEIDGLMDVAVQLKYLLLLRAQKFADRQACRTYAHLQSGFHLLQWVQGRHQRRKLAMPRIHVFWLRRKLTQLNALDMSRLLICRRRRSKRGWA